MAAARAPPSSTAMLFLSTVHLFSLAPTAVSTGESAAGGNQMLNMLQQQRDHHHRPQQQQQSMGEKSVAGGRAPHLVAYAGKLLQVEVETMLLTLGVDSQVVNVQVGINAVCVCQCVCVCVLRVPHLVAYAS